jgi:hypothetical protein
VQHILAFSQSAVIVRHWFEINLDDASMEHGARIELRALAAQPAGQRVGIASNHRGSPAVAGRSLRPPGGPARKLPGRALPSAVLGERALLTGVGPGIDGRPVAGFATSSVAWMEVRVSGAAGGAPGATSVPHGEGFRAVAQLGHAATAEEAA